MEGRWTGGPGDLVILENGRRHYSYGMASVRKLSESSECEEDDDMEQVSLAREVGMHILQVCSRYADDRKRRSARRREARTITRGAQRRMEIQRESDAAISLYLLSDERRTRERGLLQAALGERVREPSAGMWVHTLQGQPHYCICIPTNSDDFRRGGEVKSAPGVQHVDVVGGETVPGEVPPPY